jgi:hypothetical protein
MQFRDDNNKKIWNRLIIVIYRIFLMKKTIKKRLTGCGHLELKKKINQVSSINGANLILR